MIQTFLQVIFPVLLILGLGFWIGKVFHPETRTLSTLSLYLLTPALIFTSLLRYEGLFTTTTLKMLLLVTLVSVIVLAGVEIFARLFHLEKKVKTALGLTLLLSNSGNFGLPINQYAYGPEAFAVASLLLVIYSFFTNSVGVVIAAADRNSWKTAFIKMLSIPYLYVLAAALVFNYFQIPVPDSLFKPLESVGMAAIPLNLIQLGINLSHMKSSRYWGTISVAVVLKLGVIPLLAWLLLLLFDLPLLEFKVTLTQVAMPSAVYASILAAHYESDEALTSGIVFATTVFSLFSLSALITILNRL